MRHRSAVAATELALIVATTHGFAGVADQCPELTRAKASLKDGARSLANKANEALKLLKP
jgi:hypothetical protein